MAGSQNGLKAKAERVYMNVVESCDLISLYIADCALRMRKVVIAIYANVVWHDMAKVAIYANMALENRENRPMLT